MSAEAAQRQKARAALRAQTGGPLRPGFHRSQACVATASEKEGGTGRHALAALAAKGACTREEVQAAAKPSDSLSPRRRGPHGA